MISELVVILGIAGLVVLLWPASKREASPLSAALAPQSPQLPTSAQTFQGAMMSLSSVRSRLLVTDHLDEPTKSAIETITHALVDASDK